MTCTLHYIPNRQTLNKRQTRFVLMHAVRAYLEFRDVTRENEKQQFVGSADERVLVLLKAVVETDGAQLHNPI